MDQVKQRNYNKILLEIHIIQHCNKVYLNKKRSPGLEI